MGVIKINPKKWYDVEIELLDFYIASRRSNTPELQRKRDELVNMRNTLRSLEHVTPVKARPYKLPKSPIISMRKIKSGANCLNKLFFKIHRFLYFNVKNFSTLLVGIITSLGSYILAEEYKWLALLAFVVCLVIANLGEPNK